jgi:hypothetical protein
LCCSIIESDCTGKFANTANAAGVGAHNDTERARQITCAFVGKSKEKMAEPTRTFEIGAEEFVGGFFKGLKIGFRKRCSVEFYKAVLLINFVEEQ